MRSIKLNRDIMPLSEFRSTLSSSIEKLQETLRPILLTQHGKGVAVVMDVNEFEEMRERLEILESISDAHKQFVAGKGVPHEEAKARVLKRLHDEG